MTKLCTYKRNLKLLFCTIVLFVFVGTSIAQPVLPQRTLTVTPAQSINFGSICMSGSAGGAITVGYNGSITSTGDIILLAEAPTAQPAIFEVKLCQGRNVSITFSATTILTGSSGGTLTLDIGPTERGSNGAFFTTNSDCDFITPLRVGGTLHIPGTATQGIYTGSFEITFNQE